MSGFPAPSAAKVAVVIPAFNEARTIADVARRARAQVDRVIVVDDGSTDDTGERLRGLEVQVIRNAQNQGKALSLWRGMQQALADGAQAVITLDGDGQHQPEDIPRVLEVALKNPGSLVIASRQRGTENAPRVRLFANRFANFWISWAAGYRISDSQSGFRVYPAEVLCLVTSPQGRSSSFAFESSVLIEAAWHGHRSMPVAIDSVYFPAGRPSHYRPVLDTVYIVLMVAGRLLKRGMNPLGLWRVIRG